MRLQWVPDIHFSRGTTRLMSWPDGECFLRSLQSLVVSLVLFLVSTFVFSRTRGILPHLNPSTHRFPRFSPRNLCSFVTLAVLSLVYAATDTAFFLGSYLFRICRIENPSCSICEHSSQDTSHLILHCPASDSLRRLLFGDSLSLRPLVQALASCSASGAPWSSAMPPSLGRGWVTITTRVYFSAVDSETKETRETAVTGRKPRLRWSKLCHTDYLRHLEIPSGSIDDNCLL